MRISYFGDSYDIVKQSLLRWLGEFGEWRVHPMFTEAVMHTDVVAFESLLSVKVVSTDILTVDSDRAAYLACGSFCGHLFLDPDKGLRMRRVGGKEAPKYVFGNELRWLAEQRPDSLTMVFDQSVPRGSERDHMMAKLGGLRQQEVFGFAYISHACFLVAGQDHSLVEQARARVIAESRLPGNRFLSISS